MGSCAGMTSLSSESFFRLLLTCNSTSMMIARIRVRFLYSSVLSPSSLVPLLLVLSVSLVMTGALYSFTYFRMASMSTSVREGKVFICVLLYWLYNAVKYGFPAASTALLFLIQLYNSFLSGTLSSTPCSAGPSICLTGWWRGARGGGGGAGPAGAGPGN